MAVCTTLTRRPSSARPTATVVTTDGPFVETKEFLAGFYILEADDLDGALAWASKAADGLGISIEVRPFAGASAR